MKNSKILSLLFLCNAFSLLMTFSACSSDDDEGNNQGGLVGTWERIYDRDKYPDDVYEIWKFKSNGKGSMEHEEGSFNFTYTYQIDDDDDDRCISSGQLIYIDDGDTYPEKVDIAIYPDNTMIWYRYGSETKFKRK